MRGSVVSWLKKPCQPPRRSCRTSRAAAPRRVARPRRSHRPAAPWRRHCRATRATASASSGLPKVGSSAAVVLRWLLVGPEVVDGHAGRGEHVGVRFDLPLRVATAGLGLLLVELGLAPLLGCREERHVARPVAHPELAAIERLVPARHAQVQVQGGLGGGTLATKEREWRLRAGDLDGLVGGFGRGERGRCILCCNDFCHAQRSTEK